MDPSELLKQKVGQAVYIDMQRQLAAQPAAVAAEGEGDFSVCSMPAGIIVRYPTYEIREQIREGIRACPCAEGEAPCANTLPSSTDPSPPVEPE
jgi:hypothetical protein